MSDKTCSQQLTIGWGGADLTPEQPVLVCGQFHARVSEGVLDPITATALALHSAADHAVFVSCDLVTIPDAVRDAVRERLRTAGAPGLDPRKVVLHATHTHTGPELRLPRFGAGHCSSGPDIDLPVMRVEEYIDFATRRIADAVLDAWRARQPGSVAFGLGHAVVGRNRRWVDVDGTAHMYGNTDTPAFSHIEGYEDHSINVLATHDRQGELTGLVLNLACTSQETESLFSLSADFWHETRQEVRRRLGRDVFIMPQCSAAGDQSPHLLFDKRAEERMLELKGRTSREDIAHRIADAVDEVLPHIGSCPQADPGLRHAIADVDVPVRALTEDDVNTALQEAAALEAEYETERRKLEADPSLRDQPRWYCPVTRAYRRMKWFRGVAERFEAQKTQPRMPVELHVVRLGDVVFATNPFEYYLDFGVYIKARSRAVQTFLIQLAGMGTYVSTRRSVAAGGYGSIPSSNPIGPEGGRLMADTTIELITQLWPAVENTTLNR